MMGAEFPEVDFAAADRNFGFANANNANFVRGKRRTCSSSTRIRAFQRERSTICWS